MQAKSTKKCSQSQTQTEKKQTYEKIQDLLVYS